MLHVVIMAGGSGTRFWPESRKARPKQLLALAGERTLLQMASDRCTPWIPPGRQWVVTNAALAEATSEQLPEVPRSHILLEPCGRNTAPCIGLAAIHLLHSDPDAVMLVTPADHVITPVAKFQAAVEAAEKRIARRPDEIVLFGIPPSYPSTGYGYIERGDASGPDHPGLYRVKSFREKPGLETAREFVAAGRYYWNSGIFVWRAGLIRRLLAEYQPDISQRLDRLSKTLGTPDEAEALRAEFPGMPSISIDHGVMEHAKQIQVLQAPFEWDDVGSWGALPRLLGSDANGNTISARHCGVDTRNCTVRSTVPGHVVATLGMEDCIIVHTPEATLVARKDDENAIRTLYAQLEKLGHHDVL
jgi:mannose-1-phosphate guanylyltransferase